MTAATEGLSFGRRMMLARGLGVAGIVTGLPGCSAVAAHGGASGLVVSPPSPCPRRPEDVVALVLEGSGAPSGTIVVFGQAFRQGQLPRGSILTARQADGRPLPTQLDVFTRHADGSARFGAICLAMPSALPLGKRLGVVLGVGAQSAARETAIALPAGLAGRQAFVEVIPTAGGTRWRADLLSLLQEQIAFPGRVWQAGPLAAQARITAQIPVAAAGTASLRLVADLSLRADGTLWVDVWLRNDIAMQTGGGAASYSLRVSLDGRELLRADGLRHHHYTAWGRMVGVASGGAVAPAAPLVRPDTDYLADVGAVARYDRSTGISQAVLARYANAVADPAWMRPLGVRGLTQYMPMTGARGDIGVTTQAQAAWLTSGDRRAAEYSMGQAETAGSVPWHMWDSEAAGGAGGWLGVDRFPKLWTDARGGTGMPGNRQSRGLVRQVPSDTGWSPDTAHQPDLAFVPYLLTARRAFLDELQAQASWNVVAHWPDPRGGDSALVVRGNQIRGAAWALRQLHEAAWATPESDSQRGYFQSCETNNWAWLRRQIPELTAAQGEAHGWLPGAHDPVGELRPWQQDHFATTAAAAARKGNADARAVLAWQSNFLVGRFLAEEKGFNPRDGVAYIIITTNQSRTPFRQWSQIGEATRARNLSNGNGWSKSGGNYAQLALATLASIADVLELEEARRAYAWLLAAGAPFTQARNFANDPVSNITPNGMPRIPAQQPRCAG